ncbi:MAG: 3-oxoacyl-ACP reductase [Myxococcales bacterium]|nr:3-oxoacyl-ACP reductase [Myxococcales bacterium]
MTDLLLELSQNRIARDLVARAKLPVPLPERLERVVGPTPERPLDDARVLVAGIGDLGQALGRALGRAGAQPLLLNSELLGAFSGPGEAYGRHPQLVGTGDAEHAAEVRAIVLDATGLQDADSLKLLYDVFHPWLRALSAHGRAVILGRPPASAKTLGAAAAAAALDGFTRSLAKEIGGRAATANLILVEPGAEDRIAAPLRFFLSRASAFVSAQNLRVSAATPWDGDDPIAQPLSNRVALVTGAARGIGEAIANTLAADGAHVICVDRPAEDAALATVARRVGGSALPLDVLDADAAEGLQKYLLEHHDGLDLLIHNAGITRDRTLLRMDEARWDQCLGVNLKAILAITEKLLERGLRDGGRIVSLASIAGIAGNNGQTNYAASKAGVIGFTRHLAGQLAPRGICVNAVAPGFIETQMTAVVPAVVRQAGRRLAALGQGGLPEDVAQAVGFLCAPGSAGLSGNVLRICGGALIGA